MADETKKADGAHVNSNAEEELLTQIREDFRYVKEYWRENYEEAEKDMRFVACIPPKEFEEDRQNRPCIWPDELSQYVKQSNNNLRQNKRSIKLAPRSEGATDTDAEHRQAYIRGIEYASKAQSIYSTAYEAATECGFGFWRVNCRVTGPNGEQEPRIVRIPNQFTTYLDPDAREADFSDGNIAFVLDRMRQTKFGRKYRNAKKRSFTGTDIESAPDWFSGQDIIVAEYWHRTELEEKDGEKRYKVVQHITNGVEILETNQWIGSWIPIIGLFGEEIYVKTGGESKRVFLSLIRRARGPQQMLAYIGSQEAEEIGMAPAAPLQGYKGQFDPEQHKDIHKVPRGYLEYGVPLDWNVNWGPPPLPTRSAFSPNLQQYEVAYERWRRSLQAAMGIGNLPTHAQRQNQKSGVALERIENQQATGSFHFIDKFVGALANTGLQLDELITKLAELDSLPKQLLGKDQKGEDVVLKVAPRSLDAASEHLDEADQFFAHRGQFEVTVSDGPNYASQREEASSFADTLLQSLPAMGLPPAISQQILAIAVKLKNIGTYGDEIADLLSPPDVNNLPPQIKAMVAQIQAQAQTQVQELTAEIQQLKLEKLGKVTEIQGRMALADKEFMTRMSEADKDRETKLAIAEVMTKAQSLGERVAAVEDLMKQFHEQAHDVAMQATEQAHQKAMAAQAAATQAAQSAAQQSANAEGPGSGPTA
ncbi:MAG TPA: portal protein [Candidatus Nitrosotalea sp.]|nr:portal protein [Candidatus Nitrosotalea sp.]